VQKAKSKKQNHSSNSKALQVLVLALQFGICDLRFVGRLMATKTVLFHFSLVPLVYPTKPLDINRPTIHHGSRQVSCLLDYLR
jgi:hypothetical protein